MEALFSLRGQVAVVTGGTGVLGGVMARGLAEAGVRVAILGRRVERAREVAEEIRTAGGEAMPAPADVLQETAVRAVREEVLERWGRVDILVNAAGGQVPGAVVPPDGSFFDLPADGLRAALDLNLLGTILPAQIFAEAMAAGGSGVIVNISSMAAPLPLTRAPAYSAAKAGIDNFTRWLAVDLARRYSPALRVNAIAPGFFLAEQNRALLMKEDGTPTERGAAALAHTPAGRFGEPRDLVGPLLWLCSPAAAFVTGTVIPVDGGFSAWWGV